MKKQLNKLHTLFETRQRRVAAGFFILALLLFRYDLFFSGPAYKIQPGDSLWSYMSKYVFENEALTRLSILHLNKNTSSSADFTVMSNSNNEGGDTMKVERNVLTITGPNNAIRVRLSVLPDHALLNHKFMVISHNILVVTLLFFLYLILFEGKFTWKSPFYIDLIGYYLVVGLLIPLGFFVAMLVYFWTVSLIMPKPIHFLYRQDLRFIEPSQNTITGFINQSDPQIKAQEL